MNQTFKHLVRVSANDIDELNHANNMAYLSWVISAAVAHSHSLGYDLNRFGEFGGIFVVKRHELDYLRPSFLDDDLIVETWISSFEGPSTTREFQILRNQKLIFRGKTVWVWVDLKTGRSKDIPESIVTDYSPYLRRG